MAGHTGERLVESAYDIDDIAHSFRCFGRLIGLVLFSCGSARSGSTTATLMSHRRRNGTVSSSPASDELGPAGLTEYRETKHLWRNTRPNPQGWFD